MLKALVQRTPKDGISVWCDSQRPDLRQPYGVQTEIIRIVLKTTNDIPTRPCDLCHAMPPRPSTPQCAAVSPRTHSTQDWPSRTCSLAFVQSEWVQANDCQFRFKLCYDALVPEYMKLLARWKDHCRSAHGNRGKQEATWNLYHWLLSPIKAGITCSSDPRATNSLGVPGL